MTEATDVSPESGKIHELLAEIDRLRAEVQAIRAAPQPEPRSTRRGALRLAGAAAVGAVGGGLALARPASAADPNDVVKNVSNPVTATTGLTGNLAGTVLQLTNSGSGRCIQANSLAFDISTIRADNSNSESVGGVALGGFAPGGRDILAGGSGRVAMANHVFNTTNNIYQTGEIHQFAGTFYCMVNGTTRRSIASPSSAGAFYPISPVRAFDSRRPLPSPGRLSTGENRVVSVADGRALADGSVTLPNAVPDGATAVLYNVVVVDTLSTGFLAVTPGSAAGFSAAIITWFAAGQTLSNSSVIGVDASRQVKVFCGGPGSTHFIVDVMGYYL
jgi:hypothetical protein